MKTNKFEILQVRELPSTIARDNAVKKDDIARSQWSYLVVFQHQEGNEAVALHVSLRCQTPNETVLLQEGVTLIARIEGWKEMAKDDKSLKGDDRIMALVDYGLSFVEGMSYRHISGTVINSVTPPHITAATIMENVVIDAKAKQVVNA